MYKQTADWGVNIFTIAAGSTLTLHIAYSCNGPQSYCMGVLLRPFAVRKLVRESSCSIKCSRDCLRNEGTCLNFAATEAVHCLNLGKRRKRRRAMIRNVLALPSYRQWRASRHASPVGRNETLQPKDEFYSADESQHQHGVACD